MAKLMWRLGSPQASIPAIHIAGTKGKGSVTHFAAAALEASGLKTGLYTSPHVENLRERILIHGRLIGEQRFVDACMAVMHEADAMRKNGCPPSYFEVLTATALVAFHAANVDVMILETGLGGRLDATNLSNMRVIAVGLTVISKDHEEILGHTLAEIAAEKAEIIRQGVPTVCMMQDKDIQKLIAEKARERRAKLFMVGKDVTVAVRKGVTPDKPSLGQRLDFEIWRNVYPDIPIAMLGRHQSENAAMALGLVDLFLEYMDRDPLDLPVLKRAWRSLVLKARLEVIGQNPWRIVDGAHNPASTWVAAETIAESFSADRRALIFGVAKEKDWRTMLRILAPQFNYMVLTTYDSPRAADPADLSAFLSKEYPDIKIVAAMGPAHALELAEDFTSANGLILACGSLYLAGEIRTLCRRDQKKDKAKA